MRKLLSIALLFFISNMAMAQDATAKRILDDMKKKYETFNAFSATIKQDQLTASNKVMNSFELKAVVKKEKYKLEIGEQVIYNNGKKVWRFLPEDEEVYITNANSGDAEEDMFQSPSNLYNLYKDGFKYFVAGTETVGGKSCHVIELAPIDRKKFDFFKIKLFVSKSDNTLKQWTVFEKDPDTAQIIRYRFSISNFKSGLNISDSYFTFDAAKHQDVDVIDDTE